MIQKEFDKIKALRCILMNVRGHVLVSEDGQVWEIVDESYNGGTDELMLHKLPMKAEFNFEDYWKFEAEQTYTTFPAKLDTDGALRFEN